MQELAAVGVGGLVGACLRYGITKWAKGLAVTVPLGTLLSNVIAGVWIGIIIGLERNGVGISDRAKLFLTTGLLGGLSTFSTFSMETISLFETGSYLPAMGNIALNLGLSLACVVAGLAIARLVLRTS